MSGAEFTQGMILPTANGVAKPQATSQSKATMDKTQVGADNLLQPFGALLNDPPSHPGRLTRRSCACFRQISSSSSTVAPVNTGVKIPTCKFTLKDKFLTSPADLYRVFLNQEVGFRIRFCLIKLSSFIKMDQFHIRPPGDYLWHQW